MPKKLHLHAKLNKGFGWKRPALPDFKAPFAEPHFAGPIPLAVDLRAQFAPVYDQGDLGSCTAQAWAAVHQFLHKKAGLTAYIPSRLFIYYNERVLEGTVSWDSGASLTDGAVVMRKQGGPNEAIWWYNTTKYTVKPNQSVYADGLKHLTTGTARVRQTKDDFKKILAAGYPIVGGFSVYESFESDAVTSTGVVPMPKMTEGLLGGHAIVIVGYSDEKQWWIVRNSWGAEWGDKGYCYMPYDYLTNYNLADDFWTATGELHTA